MAKPANMKQSTWEYLLKFTSNHEGVVLHMYNNKRATGQNSQTPATKPSGYGGGLGDVNKPV